MVFTVDENQRESRTQTREALARRDPSGSGGRAIFNQNAETDMAFQSPRSVIARLISWRGDHTMSSLFTGVTIRAITQRSTTPEMRMRSSWCYNGCTVVKTHTPLTSNELESTLRGD